MTEQEMGLSTVRYCSNCWNPDLIYSILHKIVFSQTMAWLRNSILSGFCDILRIEDDFASNWTCRQYYLSGPNCKTDYQKGHHPVRHWELRSSWTYWCQVRNPSWELPGSPDWENMLMWPQSPSLEWGGSNLIPTILDSFRKQPR